MLVLFSDPLWLALIMTPPTGKTLSDLSYADWGTCFPDA